MERRPAGRAVAGSGRDQTTVRPPAGWAVAGSGRDQATRYELFLRAPGALAAEALAAIEEEVARAGPALSAEPYLEGGEARGVDLAAELEQPEAAAALCGAAFRLAAAHDLAVFDPQLGRAVSEGEVALIEAQAARTSAYAELAPLSPAASGRALSSSARLWVIVIGALVVLFALARALSCLGR